MNDHPPADESMRLAQLSESEKSRIAALTADEVDLIDRCLLGHVQRSWRKLAMVVISVMFDMKDKHEIDVSYIYFYERLLRLIQENKLETQGNTDFLRWSEVRLRG